MFIDEKELLRGTRFIRTIIRSIDKYNSTAFRLANPKISSIFNWDDQLICEPVSCTFNDTVTNCELKLCKFNAISSKVLLIMAIKFIFFFSSTQKIFSVESQ